MTKLLGAMDVSGNPHVGNHLFLAVVICTPEYLTSLHKRLKSKQINLGLKNSSNRSLIASELQFGDGCLVLCCKINRDVIIDKFLQRKIKHGKQPDHRMALRSFNRQVYDLLQDRIMTFLAQHNCDRDDVVFECDSDCRGFAKDVGLRYGDGGTAHHVSDIVAWSNNRGSEPPGVARQDLGGKIMQNMQLR